MDAGILKSIPLPSVIMRGLKSMVATEKTSKIAEVFRTNMCSRQYSMAEVAEHCDHGSFWIVISDKIYDVTEFIHTHPGGEEIILEHAGYDATIPFESKGHSMDAYTMMEKYCVGQLREADRRFKTKEKT